MPLYEITADQMIPIEPTTFESLGLTERGDLQRLLKDHIEVIAPDALVLTEEFGDWEDSRRRIDLLLLDRKANLVVVELKRTERGEHMELQAIRYAAMVSTMTFSQAVDSHESYLRRNGVENPDAEQNILDFLHWDTPDEEQFGQDVSIVLASADFGRELTTAVLWLNERGLDIRCVRMIPHDYSGKRYIDVQQVIPLAEAEEYQVRVRQKAQAERIARTGVSQSNQRYLQFWTGLVPKVREKIPRFDRISPAPRSWIIKETRGLGMGFTFSQKGPRVELYIKRSEKEENLRILSELQEHKNEIEINYGGALEWDELMQSNPCRISGYIPGQSFENEDEWEDLQDEWVNRMVQFEDALSPYIKDYLTGKR